MIAKKRSVKILTVVFLVLSIFLSAWLYRFSFTSYYFQDDWFSFKISQVSSFSDFLSFFIPKTEVIYYRPLGMQIPFFLIKSLFGVSSVPFRILTFATHAVNTLLVFFLVRLLVRRNIAALLSSFFYATSAVHHIPFLWSATYAFALGPTAFFLSFILFLLFLDKRRKSYLIFSLMVFALGLLVNEIIVTLPVIIFMYLLIFETKTYSTQCHSERSEESRMYSRIPAGSFVAPLLRMTSYLLLYIFIAVLLFLPRFIFFPPPSKGIYQLGIGRHILSNIKTYFFWSFNWSEILTEQMTRPFFFNAVLTNEYGFYITVSLVTFFILSFTFYLLSLILLKFRLGKKLLRVIVFGMSWFVIGLSPVFLFPHHKYPYYLPISLVGFLLVSVCLIDRMFRVIYRFNRTVTIFFLVIVFSSWVLATESSFGLNSKIHWASRRAKIAKRLIEKARKYYKYPFEDLRIYVGKTSENKWALNDQDAFRLIYGDDRIKTIYTEETEGENVL